MTRIIFRRNGDIVRLPCHGAKVGTVVGAIGKSTSTAGMWFYMAETGDGFDRGFGFTTQREAKQAAIEALTGGP